GGSLDCAAAHFRQALAGQAVLGAPDADDRDRTSLLGEHRRRRSKEGLLELAHAHRIPVTAYGGELLPERAAIRDRCLRIPLEPPREHGLLLVVRQVGEVRLAGG